MKLERHLCDLCGGTIPGDTPYGSLVVPNFAKADVRRAERQLEDVFLEQVARAFGPVFRPAHVATTYDVCRGCIDGLLRARFLVRAKQAEFEQQTEVRE